MEAIKVKAIWHNCGKCKIHYMSEYPHIRAYLCDECWNSMPHYRTGTVKKQQPKRIQVYLKDFSITEILLYSIGNLIWLGIIGYYLWFK